MNRQQRLFIIYQNDYLMEDAYIALISRLIATDKNSVNSKGKLKMEALLQLHSFLSFQKYANKKTFGSVIEDFLYELERAHFDPRIAARDLESMHKLELTFVKKLDIQQYSRFDLQVLKRNLQDRLKNTDSKVEIHLIDDLVSTLLELLQAYPNVLPSGSVKQFSLLKDEIEQKIKLRIAGKFQCVKKIGITQEEIIDSINILKNHSSLKEEMTLKVRRDLQDRDPEEKLGEFSVDDTLNRFVGILRENVSENNLMEIIITSKSTTIRTLILKNGSLEVCTKDLDLFKKLRIYWQELLQATGDRYVTVDSLNLLEREVLKLFLEGTDPVLEVLRKQLEQVHIVQRYWTGTGFFTDFDILKEDFLRLDDANLALEGIHADITGLEGQAGFALYIRNGWMSMLEGFIRTDSGWFEEREYANLTKDTKRDRETLKRLGSIYKHLEVSPSN